MPDVQRGSLTLQAELHAAEAVAETNAALLANKSFLWPRARTWSHRGHSVRLCSDAPNKTSESGADTPSCARDFRGQSRVVFPKEPNIA